MAEVLGIIYGSPDGTLAEQGYACDSKATILAQVADKSSTSNAFEPQSFPSESSSHSITPDSVQVSGGQNQGLDQTDTLASSMPGISSKTNSIYSCANCDRKFERRMDYIRHQRMHERLYKCSYQNCPVAFASQRDRKRHQIKHHGRTQSYDSKKTVAQDVEILPNDLLEAVNPNHKLLSFSASSGEPTIIDDCGLIQNVELRAQLHGTFFSKQAFQPKTANQEIICYRRDQFQISGIVKIPRGQLSVVCEDGTRSPVQDLRINLRATESVNGNDVRLESPHTATKEKENGPDEMSLPLLSTEGETSLQVDDTRAAHPKRNSGEATEPSRTYPISFSGLRFRIATANNGRRKELQQHFTLHLNVMVTTEKRGTFSFCKKSSGPILVRGRRPANYRDGIDLPVPDTSTFSNSKELPAFEKAKSALTIDISEEAYAASEAQHHTSLNSRNASSAQWSSPTLAEPVTNLPRMTLNLSADEKHAEDNSTAFSRDSGYGSGVSRQAIRSTSSTEPDSSVTPRLPPFSEGETTKRMVKFARSRTCQFCGKSGRLHSAAPSNLWHPGPGADDSIPIWTFGINSCGVCLRQRCIKEIDLLLSSEFSSPLKAGLPYVFITNGLQVIPQSTLEISQPPPKAEIAKYYYNQDVEDLKKEFERVKTLEPHRVETWLIELESRGKSHIENSSKWAEWAAGIGSTEGSEGDSHSIISLQSRLTDITMSSVNPAGVGGAAEEVADLLERNDEIRELIMKGFETMRAERFERNFMRLLKDFAGNLRVEARNELEKGATKIVHNYRAYVTRLLHERLAGPDETRQAEAFHNIKHQETSKLMLERLLSDIAEPTVQAEAGDLDKGSDDGSGFSDDEQQALPNLGRVKDFMISSTAFISFGKSLHDFVNPIATQRSTASKTVSPRVDLVVDELKNTALDNSSAGIEQAASLYRDAGADPKLDILPEFDATEEMSDESIDIFSDKESGSSQNLNNNGINPVDQVETDLNSAEVSHTLDSSKVSTNGSGITAEEAALTELPRSRLSINDADEINEIKVDDMASDLSGSSPARLRILSWTRNQILTVIRPTVKPGYRRIEWICGCGDSLYADFKNDKNDSVNKLAAILQRPVYPAALAAGSNRSLQTVQPVASTRTCRTEFESNRAGSRNPPTSMGTASGVANQTTSNHPINQYFELCINTGEYTKTLAEINLQKVGCDGELFKRIRSEYTRLRRFRSRFWLLKPSGVHFVRFAVEEPLSVGILRKPLAIPPQSEVQAKKYSYSPCPLEDDPPMPQDVFLHYLSCTAYNPRMAWLPRLPKKLDLSILRFTGAVNYGWGVHIKEGPNYFALGLVNIAMMIISGLAAFLWKYSMNDFQGAFGFAGWIVAVVDGVLIAYIAKWQQS